MKEIDVDNMTLPELKQLKKEVDRAISSYHERKKAEAASELEAIAREKGFSLAELSTVSRRKRPPVAPKYRHPDNPSITWTGRGRRPKWINDALKQGKSLSDLAL